MEYTTEHEAITAAEIAVQLDFTDKADLLKRLARGMELGSHSLAEVLAALEERDQQPGCSVGNGIYLPHARLPGLERLGVAIATLRHPLAIATIDDQPVRIVCLTLIPAERPMEAMKLMADLVTCLRDASLYQSLLDARKPADADRFMNELERRHTPTLCARDLLIRCEAFATPDMPLRDTTRMMMERKSNTVPVLDPDGVLVGEITCNDLFRLGVPDFFNQLKSVGFIRHFDPFENYFRVELRSLTGEVMNRKMPVFHPDSTIIEIVFAMSVKRVPVIYVVDASRRLLGVITRELILARIINF